MPQRKCPECGTPLKPENVGRHFERVHPKLAAPALTPKEQEAARRPRPPSAVRMPRGSTVAAVALIILVVAGLAVAIPRLPGQQGSMHIHPRLAITVDGNARAVPGNIGINPALWNDHSLDGYGMEGMAPLHTHDASGTIHVESNAVRSYTLGEFFRIWGESFDSTQVLGHRAGLGHRVWMVVDVTQMSPSYDVAFRDGVTIEIVCGAA